MNRRACPAQEGRAHDRGGRRRPRAAGLEVGARRARGRGLSEPRARWRAETLRRRESASLAYAPLAPRVGRKCERLSVRVRLWGTRVGHEPAGDPRFASGEGVPEWDSNWRAPLSEGACSEGRRLARPSGLDGLLIYYECSATNSVPMSRIHRFVRSFGRRPIGMSMSNSTAEPPVRRVQDAAATRIRA